MAPSLTAVLEGSPSRDYSMVGEDARRAVAGGLADAEWFRPHVDPDRLAELTERTTARALADVLLWFALLIGLGTAAVLSLGNWWAIPLFAAYGALYGGSADARWHEFGHGTATRSELINNVVYYIASFCLWRGPTLWRWSHFRHHSDTIVVGRDPEIQVPRPPTIRKFLFNYTNLVNGPRALARLVRHAFGRIDDDARDFVPESEQPKMVWEARVFVAILVAVAAVSVAVGSIVPLLLIGLPTIYGAWLMVFFGATQHLGLREDVLDHRANSRTVYINPVFRFLYLNMNYHIEHHMFPAVPYYRLPALHAEVRDALPEPNPSMWSAYRELVGELWRQRRDATHELAGRSIPDVPAAMGQAINHAMTTELAGGRYDLGPLDALPPGTMRGAEIAGRPLVVARLASGEVCVVDGICTHGHAHLASGALVDGCIECPKHNGRFDLATGEPRRRPVRVPLGTYDVTVAAGRITTTLTTRPDDALAAGPAATDADPGPVGPAPFVSDADIGPVRPAPIVPGPDPDPGPAPIEPDPAPVTPEPVRPGPVPEPSPPVPERPEPSPPVPERPEPSPPVPERPEPSPPVPDPPDPEPLVPDPMRPDPPPSPSPPDPPDPDPLVPDPMRPDPPPSPSPPDPPDPLVPDPMRPDADVEQRS